MDRFLKPGEVVPKDDSYHGNINLVDSELWHFEAVFDNGYRINFGLMIHHLGSSGIVQTRLSINEKGKVKVKTNRTYLFSNVNVSNESPFIKIGDNLTIMFDQEHYIKTKEWIYNILIMDKNYKIDLKFIGTSVGWKTKTDYTNWAVILPKASVIGSISIEEHQISLKGKGYHDHNWGQIPRMLLRNIGWFCGTINTDTLKLTWAKELGTYEKGGLFVVINQDINYSHKTIGFQIIPTKNVVFSIKNFEYKQGFWIPSKINLKIKDTILEDEILMSGNLHMEILDIQSIRFFTIRYCVCLAKITGMLTFGSKTEFIDHAPHFIEFPSFFKKRSNIPNNGSFIQY